MRDQLLEKKRPSSGISMKEKRKELCTFLFCTIFQEINFGQVDENQATKFVV